MASLHCLSMATAPCCQARLEAAQFLATHLLLPFRVPVSFSWVSPRRCLGLAPSWPLSVLTLLQRPLPASLPPLWCQPSPCKAPQDTLQCPPSFSLPTSPPAGWPCTGLPLPAGYPSRHHATGQRGAWPSRSAFNLGWAGKKRG